jgi:hypothetical protein
MSEREVIRTRADAVELIMSPAGRSAKHCRRDMVSTVFASLLVAAVYTAVPVTAAMLVSVIVWAFAPNASFFPLFVTLPLAAIGVACFAAVLESQWPHTLRITFVPADRPTEIRVVRWWRTVHVPISTVSMITVVEHRMRYPGRHASPGSLERIDAVLHRTDGRTWRVRGNGMRWYPDSDPIYETLPDLLAPAGVTVERKIHWLRYRRPSSSGTYGSGGANFIGGGF